MLVITPITTTSTTKSDIHLFSYPDPDLYERQMVVDKKHHKEKPRSVIKKQGIMTVHYPCLLTVTL